jgi:hypothetical protein
MIRPRYHLGDRSGQVEFPLLRVVVMNFSCDPLLFGWICPNLECLVYLPRLNRDPWEDSISNLDFVKKLGKYPRLKCVVLADFVANPFDECLRPRFVAYPPVETPWESVRLLWLAVSRPTPGCPMSSLSKDMCRKILSYLNAGWRLV